MSRKTDIIMSTDEEDAAINRGIAQDADNPELTEADFATMRASSEVTPALARAKRVRGPQKSETKRLISLRLDSDVLERLKQDGPGWQTRANALLRRSMGL